MSLGEHEHFWQEYGSEIDLSPDDEIRVRQEVLQNAERKSLDNLEDPFGSPILLRFDEGSLVLQLRPWLDEEKPYMDRPVLAEVQFSSSDKLPAITHAVEQFIVLDGASIQNTMTENEIGVIAQNCNLSYRLVSKREVDYFDPLDITRHLPFEEALKKSTEIERLRREGRVRFEHGRDVEYRTGHASYYTPPVRQVLEKDAKPVFTEIT